MVLDDANKLGLTELRWLPLKFENGEARKAKGNNAAGIRSCGNRSKDSAHNKFQTSRDKSLDVNP